MNVGIYGGVELQFTDHITGEVSTLNCPNLITKYGLKRLFGPKNLTDKCANFICFGYKEDEPSVDESVIPDTYIKVQVNESAAINTAPFTSTYRNWMANLHEANAPEGFRINHIYLAYTDDDGIVRPITSLKLKDVNGQPVDYTHINTTMLTASYTIFLNIVPGTINSSVVTGVELSDYLYNATNLIPYELKEKNRYYEGTWNGHGVASGPSYIKSSSGEFNSDGDWVQRYEINITPYQYGTRVSFYLGICPISLITISGRGTETVNVDLVVKALSSEELLPRPVTSIDIKPRNQQYNMDMRYVEISAPPYQWVDMFFGKYYLSSVYIGATGKAWISSYYYKILNLETGQQEEPANGFILSSGESVTFVSRTAAGKCKVDLITPDKENDDLIAIWFTSPTTIRAVARYNDNIKLYWYTDPYVSSPTRYDTTAKAEGTCTTQFEDDNRYYYCDIDVSSYDPQLSQEIGYTCTDAAGNVYSDLDPSLANYVPGYGYEQAKRPYVSVTDIYISDDINTYSMSLKILSGVIT